MMPSVEIMRKNPSSPVSKKSQDKHDSKKRKRDVTIDKEQDEADMKKTKGEEQKGKEKDKGKKKEKRKEGERGKDSKKDTKEKKIDAVEQTTRKEESKKLKEKLQSMVIHDTVSLVTEPLSSNKTEGASSNPAATSTTPPSPLKPILKSSEKRMDTSKPPLETVDSNAGITNGTSTVPKSALIKPSKAKKSVKFHSEAAAEDGESRQRIHNALIAAYKASEAAEEATVTSEELASSLEANAPPAKKQKREKRKKEKKEKAKKNGKDENAKQSALSYMLEYHKHRETWKFQKAKQNWILRNTFDVTEIEGTKENGAALKAYISGLQGQEARNRLLEEAKKILKSGEEGAKKDSEGVVEMDEGMKKRLERAKLVMTGLGHEDDEEAEEDAVEETGKGSGVQKADATADDDEDEDSADESEDDDSDGSEDD